jgi:hypothetical protein
MLTGGARPGSGRPKGSKNKLTLAKQAVAEVLDAPTDTDLTQAVHQRGHKLLNELEKIAMDPSQPVAARIVAAKTALPFLLPKCAQEQQNDDREFAASLIKRLHEGRQRAAMAR